jgi:hypothetical protein
LPTGFSVTDSKGTQGVARVTKGISSVGTDGIVVNNQFITGSVGPNVLIDQLITVDGTGTRYTANGINIGWIGNWNSVEIKSTDSSIDRLSNGQYLITATFNLGYLNESDFVIPTGSRGYDLADAPKSITTSTSASSAGEQLKIGFLAASGYTVGNLVNQHVRFIEPKLRTLTSSRTREILSID